MSSSSVLISKELSLIHSDSISRILKIFVFTILTVLGAKLEIPTQPVPFTLQTLFVLLSGAFLGKRDGAISQLVYLSLGISGLPVFAGTIVGFARIIGPTGGYLIAFPIAAFLIGWMVEFKGGIIKNMLYMFIGVFAIYFFGIVHLNTFYIQNINESAISGLAIFSVWELVKVVAAGVIFTRLNQ